MNGPRERPFDSVGTTVVDVERVFDGPVEGYISGRHARSPGSRALSRRLPRKVLDLCCRRAALARRFIPNVQEDFMSSSISPEVGDRGSRRGAVRTDGRRRTSERRTTETKAAFKTTEFASYVAVLAGILIAGLVVDDGAGAFGAEKVWLFATILTVGYMISRGLAKAGWRDP